MHLLKHLLGKSKDQINKLNVGDFWWENIAQN